MFTKNGPSACRAWLTNWTLIDDEKHSCYLKPHLHYTALCTTSCSTGKCLYTWMQPIIKPVVQLVWQLAASCVFLLKRSVVSYIPSFTCFLSCFCCASALHHFLVKPCTYFALCVCVCRSCRRKPRRASSRITALADHSNNPSFILVHVRLCQIYSKCLCTVMSSLLL